MQVKVKIKLSPYLIKHNAMCILNLCTRQGERSVLYPSGRITGRRTPSYNFLHPPVISFPLMPTYSPRQLILTYPRSVCFPYFP